MDTPTPSGSGPVAAPQSAAVTSHTLYPGGSAEVDYDQTIKFKTPGSGMTVFNRYKLERVLGRGGMGVVWLADDLKLERPVALKFLPSLIGLDPAAVKELKTETRRGLELSHPHIVRIYDFVDDEDAAAISMEFVDGKTLSELRMGTEFGVFTVDDISRWLLGVCDALDYAHFQRKLIHRDLKPANIMLTSKEAVAKIADFGIARSLSDTMSRLSVANLGTSGTLPYMSPQQAMGERPQPTDDVYSLGATIYELLTGKPPFYRGDLPTQINSKIPPSVQERRTELEISCKESIPKVWEEAIAACLHKEPTLRPSCAGALAEMLGLKPATVTVRTGAYAAATAAANARSLSQKASSRAPLIAAAATVIVGAGAAAYFFVNSKPEAKQTPSAKATTSVVTTADAAKKGVTKAEDKGEPQKAATSAEPTLVKVTEAPTGSPSQPPATSAGTVPPAGLSQPAMPSPPAGYQPPTLTAAVPPVLGGMASTDPATVPNVAAVASNPTLTPSTQPPPALAMVGATPAPVLGTQIPVGGLAMTPDPATATQGALAATQPPAPAMPPLPPGFEVPPGGLVLTQPSLPEPTTGFWTLEQVFPVLPHASYSPKGKRYLLFRTQSLLKEKGLYTASVDGEEGKSTHNAIVLFQVRSGLQPNGLLDLPTLAALQLSAEVDKADWSPPSSGGGSGGTRRRTQTKEEPGFLQKTGDTLKRLNPFGK
ncbi:serine/threonine-protein kinase [Prosthecobacter dejongeii]|uniref:Serine/threonine protein kinase n=1 Tax=Prosthecobacter dejongeii TaxID=48465 RepID=A0A7W7YNU9_9BACT|nr:serine/threonine-protein kinase [Prosthecobacter dejongeii]MBB5039641.1 serine/threonine protein kinase [Prosthecobacter dejongeii]